MDERVFPWLGVIYSLSVSRLTVCLNSSVSVVLNYGRTHFGNAVTPAHA